MRYGYELREQVYSKTDGYCYLCGGEIALESYGVVDDPQAWVFEHCHPQAKGGTDVLDNLFPAHPMCNWVKGTKSLEEARKILGYEEPGSSDWIFYAAVGVMGLLWLKAAVANKTARPGFVRDSRQPIPSLQQWQYPTLIPYYQRPIYGQEFP